MTIGQLRGCIGHNITVTGGFGNIPPDTKGILIDVIRAGNGWEITVSLRYERLLYGFAMREHALTLQRFNASIKLC